MTEARYVDVKLNEWMVIPTVKMQNVTNKIDKTGRFIFYIRWAIISLSEGKERVGGMWDRGDSGLSLWRAMTTSRLEIISQSYTPTITSNMRATENLGPAARAWTRLVLRSDNSVMLILFPFIYSMYSACWLGGFP